MDFMRKRIALFVAVGLVSSTCLANDLEHPMSGIDRLRARESQSQTQTPFIPVNEYCHALVSNPTLMRFAKANQEIQQSDLQASLPLEELFEPGTPISDWVAGKMQAAFSADRDATRAWRAYVNEVYSTCGKELVDDSDHTFTRGDISNAKQAYDQCRSEKVKKIADDGSVQMVAPSCDAEAKGYYERAEQSLVLPQVLAFKNGDKVLATGAEETLAKLDSDIAQAKVAKVKSDAEKLARQKQEEAGKVAQAEKDKARIARINQMKATGDYSTAQHCSEIAEVLGAKKIIAALPNQLISADNSNYNLFAYLYEFNGNGGYIYNAMSETYAGIKTTSRTIWFSKQKIQVKGAVQVVGRYVGNGSVTLVSGAAQPTRVYEVLCMQPSDSEGFYGK